MAISDDRHIFAAWSADFLIKEYDSTGAYVRAFYYPFKKVALTDEEALEMQKGRENAEYFQKVLRHAGIPSSWPALYAVKVDDQNQLWVATIVEDQQVYQWWVLDAVADGHILARFTWPRDKPIEAVKDGKLYTRETEEETGLQQIVRYDITMTEQ